MTNAFHLLDLVSQAAAVQRVLRGRSGQDKLSWLAARGRLERVSTAVPGVKPTHRFTSTLGIECLFFLDAELIVFLGDHTTFVVGEAS